jgi:hypothetical protein
VIGACTIADDFAASTETDRLPYVGHTGAGKVKTLVFKIALPIAG